MLTALKTDGWIYTSFKYGEYEGNRNGRHFTDFTIDTFPAEVERTEGKCRKHAGLDEGFY